MERKERPLCLFALWAKNALAAVLINPTGEVFTLFVYAQLRKTAIVTCQIKINQKGNTYAATIEGVSWEGVQKLFSEAVYPQVGGCLSCCLHRCSFPVPAAVLHSSLCVHIPVFLVHD